MTRTDPAPRPDGAPWSPSPERLDELRRAVRGLVSAPLPPPGNGDTPRRWRALHRWARTGSVSVARLAEAHLDAVAILAEAAVEVDDRLEARRPNGLYGVWASSGPSDDLRFDRGDATISGTKGFCSGLGIVDRALVTADDAHGATWLVAIDVVAGPSLRLEPGPWATLALADTATGSLRADRHPVRPVGAPGWYLARPGFWHGAIGPAACWAGAAAGLADRAELHVRDDPFQRAAQGELRAWDLTCRTLLDAAGQASDRAPLDGDAARYRALATRHTIERAVTAMADRFGQAFGPRPYVTDGDTAQRLADLHLYVRQHHGERDLAQLASLPYRPDPDGQS